MFRYIDVSRPCWLLRACSVGGVRQQFSNAENVRLSLDSSKFISAAAQHLGVDGDTSSCPSLHPGGYLFLATRSGEATLVRNHAVQTSCGASIALMSPSQLQRKFPWLNVEDISLGAFGT